VSQQEREDLREAVGCLLDQVAELREQRGLWFLAGLVTAELLILGGLVGAWILERL
jgi:hypothetical protein